MLLVVAFVAFALFAFVGDPVNIILGTSYTEADRVRVTHEMGLDQPFLVQYAKYRLGGAAWGVRGELPAGAAGFVA